MGKKIKSVRLKNDFRNAKSFSAKGNALFKTLSFWYLNESNNCGLIKFSEDEILNSGTDLFEIEYEPERKFIDVRIEYDKWVCCGDSEITANLLETNLSTQSQYIGCNLKVTELNQCWTDEDMVEFGYFFMENVGNGEECVKKFKQEKSK